MSYRIAVVHKDDSGNDVVFQVGATFDSLEDAQAKVKPAGAEAKTEHKDAEARVEQLVIERDEKTGEPHSAEWTEVS